MAFFPLTIVSSLMFVTMMQPPLSLPLQMYSVAKSRRGIGNSAMPGYGLNLILFRKKYQDTASRPPKCDNPGLAPAAKICCTFQEVTIIREKFEWAAPGRATDCVTENFPDPGHEAWGWFLKMAPGFESQPRAYWSIMQWRRLLARKKKNNRGESKRCKMEMKKNKDAKRNGHICAHPGI